MDSANRVQSALDILRDISRLTVTRSILTEPPMQHLRLMVEALINNKPLEAECEYHALTSALLYAPARRVSGNLLTDYVYYVIIERPNIFSEAAARGFIDTPVYAAMREDISILLSLPKRICSDAVCSWLESATGIKRRREDDDASIIAQAVWSGTTPMLHKSKPASAYDECLTNSTFDLSAYVTEYSCASWDYGEFELRDTYVCDAALEELYRRCAYMQTSTLTDDLWNFFESCGTGIFLKDRLFEYRAENNTDSILSLSGSIVTADAAKHCLCEAERERLLCAAINFMRDDELSNILICGGRNLGKTSALFYAANELPEVRLVVSDGKDASRAIRYAYSTLKNQPLKFILFIDGADGYLSDIEHEMAAMRSVQPANVLVCVAMEMNAASPLFSVNIKFTYPDPQAFAEYLLSVMPELTISLAQLSAVCAEYAEQTNMPLSYGAAQNIIKQLTSEE